MEKEQDIHKCIKIEKEIGKLEIKEEKIRREQLTREERQAEEIKRTKYMTPEQQLLQAIKKIKDWTFYNKIVRRLAKKYGLAIYEVEDLISFKTSVL